MHRVAELERLAQVASQQAAMTTNTETRHVLLSIADGFTTAANDRRAALSAVRQLGPVSRRA